PAPALATARARPERPWRAAKAAARTRAARAPARPGGDRTATARLGFYPARGARGTGAKERTKMIRLNASTQRRPGDRRGSDSATGGWRLRKIPVMSPQIDQPRNGVKMPSAKSAVESGVEAQRCRRGEAA